MYLGFGSSLLYKHFALLKVVHISTRLALLIPASPLSLPTYLAAYGSLRICQSVSLSLWQSGKLSVSQPLRAVSQIVAFDDTR